MSHRPMSPENRIVRASAPLPDAHADRGRPEDVTGLEELRFHPVGDPHGLPELGDREAARPPSPRPPRCTAARGGGAVRPSLSWRYFLCSTSSTWIRAESSITIRAISAVGPVQNTGPGTPAFTGRGSRPQWSRCAWVRSTASRRSGGTGSGSQFRDCRSRSCCRPQSTSTRARGVQQVARAGHAPCGAEEGEVSPGQYGSASECQTR